MADYQKYINALRKCAKEHENDRTSIGHIIVSDLCKDTANLLEALKHEPCDDTISRQTVAEFLRDHSKDFEDARIKMAFMAASSLVENTEYIPPVTHTQRWIPVSERLPKEGERVLATHLGGVNPDNQVIEHIYQCGKFTCGWDMDINVDSPTFGQRYMGEVIAWMPLPEPYKEEKGE